MSQIVQLRRRLFSHALGFAVLGGLAACGETPAPAIDAVLPAEQALEPNACDLAGTWAIRFDVPVSWAGNFGVQGGQGVITQYVKSQRTVDGHTVTDTLQVCGNVVPDYRSGVLAGNELYGVYFPDALFDSGVLPTAEVRTHVSGLTVGSTYQSEAAVVQIGIKMADPLNDLWPRSFVDLQGVYDADGNGHPGVTAMARTGGAYALPRTTLAKDDAKRAVQFYTAMRNVAHISGTIDQCDRLVGRAQIAQLGGRAALNSHVLGCLRVDGTQCPKQDTSIIDGFAPVYSTRGEATATQLKIPAGSTCADVRAANYQN